MRPRYFREDFESDASNGLLVFIGVILAACSIAIGAVMGFEYRSHLQREAERNKPLPVRKAAQNPPPSLYPCTTDGRIEYERTCRAQKRMSQIGVGK